MHAIIAAALKDLGVPTTACPGEDQPFTGTLCFQHRTAGDLVIGTDKVVGSAQRRDRGALLQHGAILLAASPHTPILPGIHELSQQSPTVPQLAAALEQALARETGWDLAPADWTATERQRIDELVAGKYSRDDWNRKR
jgi:lipoate-protein ligase A